MIKLSTVKAHWLCEFTAVRLLVAVGLFFMRMQVNLKFRYHDLKCS